jgi:hypothetical protein
MAAWLVRLAKTSAAERERAQPLSRWNAASVAAR